jgi:hypothetical protein
MTRLRIPVLVSVLAACLLGPAAAHAAITIDTLTAAPAAPAAGSHIRLDLSTSFSGDPLQDLQIDLPPGLVGNPRAVAACPQAQFAAASCPATSQVGTTSVTTSLPLIGTATGEIYNVAPGAGEVARLGAVLHAALGVTLTLPVTVALRPDGGLTTRIDDIPSSANGIPIGDVRSMQMSLGGSVAPRFMTAPTGCSAGSVVMRATSRSGTASAPKQAAIRPVSCAALPFRPALSASIGARGPAKARNKPTFRTVVTVPDGDATSRRTAVALPARLGLDLAHLPPVCAQAQASADACPAASRVGSVQAESPLLPAPLSGPVFIAAVPGELLPGLHLSLSGIVKLQLNGTMDLSHGVTSVFDGLPDVPLTRLVLTFTGGGPLQVRRDPCTGSLLRMTGSLTGHNGADATVPARVKVLGCPARASGRFAKHRIVLHVRKGRDTRDLNRVRVTLPSGRRITRSLAAAKAVTLRIAAHKRPHGTIRVQVTRVNGKRSTVVLKAARLR